MTLTWFESRQAPPPRRREGREVGGAAFSAAPGCVPVASSLSAGRLAPLGGGDHGGGEHRGGSRPTTPGGGSCCPWQRGSCPWQLLEQMVTHTLRDSQSHDGARNRFGLKENRGREQRRGAACCSRKRGRRGGAVMIARITPCIGRRVLRPGGGCFLEHCRCSSLCSAPPPPPNPPHPQHSLHTRPAPHSSPQKRCEQLHRCVACKTPARTVVV